MKNPLAPGHKEHRYITTFSEACASAPEARCQCGQLVAKLTAEGVEVKCKRCKRIVVLPFRLFGLGETHFDLCQ